MSSDEQAALKSMLEQFYATLKKQFIFPDFKISVAPCGQPNAFSAPDIRICTELLRQLQASDQRLAVAPILLHEVGHSLLNVWGMPGYDNEDIADEFMAAVLLSGTGDEGVEMLSAAVTWFSARDSAAEATAQLHEGSRHAPSVQRIRNLERIMSDPAPVISRWKRLLYRHMTPQALEQAISRPEPTDDVALAKRALAALKAAEISGVEKAATQSGAE